MKEKTSFPTFCGNILGVIRKLLLSKYFFILPFALAVYIKITGNEVKGAIYFILLESFILIFSEDIAPSLLPFVLCCIFPLNMYDSFNTYIQIAIWAIPLIIALVLRLILYRKHFANIKSKIGSSVIGLLAVSVAITLGGVGIIPKKDYFDAVNIYYLLGLGFGMVLLYVVLCAEYKIPRDYDVKEYYSFAMTTAGLFAVFMVFFEYYKNWETFIADNRILSFQWSNNIVTVLIIVMPFAMMAARKYKLFYIAPPLFLFAALLTDSQSGYIICGSFFLFMYVFMAFYDRNNLCIYMGTLLLIAILITVNSEEISLLYSNIINETKYIFGSDSKYSRYSLMQAAVIDFKESPFVGKGIGYTGNVALYPADPRGAMHWYHMLPFQVIGSMGFLGIICYLTQFVTRIRIVIKKWSPFSVTVGLSYIGIVFMSMVNPGLFCPIPYSFLTVLSFVLAENADKSDKVNT